MGINLRKEIIDNAIENIIGSLNFEAVGFKDFLRQKIDVNDIFMFFVDGIDADTIKDLILKNSNPIINNNEDLVFYATIMVKQEVLRYVLKALRETERYSNLLTDEELLNILIDLKNSDDLKPFQKIIADTLEGNLDFQ